MLRILTSIEMSFVAIYVSLIIILSNKNKNI
jgi:hypothetical protein